MIGPLECLQVPPIDADCINALLTHDPTYFESHRIPFPSTQGRIETTAGFDLKRTERSFHSPTP